jgi:hypothetical protein
LIGLRLKNYILFSLFSFCLACSPFISPKPPVLLILLESFSEKDFLCSDIELLEGLEQLSLECEKFFRFTHAYTPSSMTQPAIATLFTGEEIKVHDVVNNGPSAIAGPLQTLAEDALNLEMRTSLFSGGIPLLPKFGVRQGFEVYNDSFSQKKNSYFRDFSETLDRSMKWMDEEVGRRSFFITYYVPDLLYQNLMTVDNFGEERPVNRQAQLHEIYETLNQLIVDLKKRKRWDNSHIIILGLNGEIENLLPTNPLSSQIFHVALQIKLAKLTKTNIQSITDKVISFNKIGMMIRQLINHKPSQGHINFIENKEDDFIPQVSHWKKWLNLSNIVDLGLRKKQYLFAWTPKFSVYDSFGDKKETDILSKKISQNLIDQYDLKNQVQKYFENECYDASFLDEGWLPSKANCEKPFQNLSLIRDMTLIIKWTELLNSSDNPSDQLSHMVNKSMGESEPILLGWLAFQSLYLKNWTNLFELGKQTNNKSWQLISQTNLRENPNFEIKNCLKYFVDERLRIENFYKHCQDTELRKIVEGIHNLKNKIKPSAGFWDQVSDIKNQRRAKEINLKTYFLNDIKKPFEFQPSLAELYFFLPENSEFQKLIQIDEA